MKIELVTLKQNAFCRGACGYGNTLPKGSRALKITLSGTGGFVTAFYCENCMETVFDSLNLDIQKIEQNIKNFPDMENVPTENDLAKNIMDILSVYHPEKGTENPKDLLGDSSIFLGDGSFLICYQENDEKRIHQMIENEASDLDRARFQIFVKRVY